MADRRAHEFVVGVVVPDGMTVQEMAEHIVKVLDRADREPPFPEPPRVRHVPKRVKPRKGG